MSVSYNKKTVFAAACLAIFLFGLTMISLGTLMPFIGTHSGLGALSKGMLATVLPFGILAGSLIFGPVIDRYGYRYLLTLSVILLISGFFLITRTQSFSGFLTAFFLIGTGGGILNGSSNALVSGLSEDIGENKAANLSLMGVFYGIGALGMPSLLALLIKNFSYNEIVNGIVWFMLLPMVFFLLIRYPVNAGGSKISLKNWLNLLGTPLMLLIGMVGFFQSGLESMVNNWFTTYLTGNIGVDEKDALFTLTLFVAVFTVSRLILGFVLRKVKPSTVISLSMMLVILGILLLIFYWKFNVAVIAVIFIGLGLASTFPIIAGHTGDLFKTQPGTAMSILFTLSLLGNMTINYMTGWFTARTALKSYPYLFMAVAIFTFIYIGLFYRRLNKYKT
jgi:MFS transporter, FHS family, glucose/mannose:H+ symporter